MIDNGTPGDDNGASMLIGSNAADTLNGYGGNDDLHGLGSNDILIGDPGNEVINGGAGIDLVSYAYATHSVSVGLGANGSGSASGGDDWIQSGAGTDCLYRGAGGDTLDQTGSGAVKLSLATNTVSGGHAQGDVVSGFEHVLGTAFSDTISDNGAVNWLWGGQGSDNVRGGGGGDRLRGMEGADMVWGGAGAGTFYICLGESGPTAGRRDTIEDFSESQGDRIDLSGFRTGADDWQLDFVGGDAFTGVREIRAEISGGNTYVTASVDGGIDMWLKLEGVVTLGANDLFL